MKLRTLDVFAVLLVVVSAPLPAQGEPFLPGVEYDPAIPTPQRVLGYELGEEISLHAEVVAYLRALEAGSDRIRLVEYGRSWQGRALYYAVIAAPERLAALPAIQAGYRQLADPRTLAAGEGARLVAELPAVGWLAYCVHGDEASGSDAALRLAYHLLAVRGDALVDRIFAECVVILDPLQNPDGRDRFVHATRDARGLEPAAEPDAAEHRQPWPGGRVNHYLFDMNRDWFAMSQPETRARIAAFLQWWPLVYVDLHEMGGNSTYYFAPPADPVNPEITAGQRAWLELYGRNNAAWFDRFGIDYFTRENYDAFYPGYGDSWPTFQGSIGMTYEQASPRGLVYRRDDESLLTYRQAVQHHFLASLATLETLARGRQEALQAFLDYRRSAVDEAAASGPLAFVFPDRGDRARLARLVGLLASQGIEVHRAASELACVAARPLVAGPPAEDAAALDEGGDGEVAPETAAAAAAQTFAAGSYVVRMDQPSRRLATVLLSREVDLDEDFVAEQLRKEQRRQSTDFYDLTAWSLPLLFDVEAWACEAPVMGELELLAAEDAGRTAAAVPERAPQVAYLVPWTTAGAALLVELLRAGVTARTMDEPFRIGGRDYGPGAYVVKVAGQPEGLHELVLGAARRHGAEVVGTDTSWVESGIHFGSNRTHVVREPAIAMAWDRPVGRYSAGWTRFLLERRYGLPVTPIRTQDLSGADLDRYTVLVLPDGGGYGRALGERGAERIKQWIERGGVLVALAGAKRWLAEEEVGLLAARPEDRQPGAAGATQPAAAQPTDAAPAGGASAEGAGAGAAAAEQEPEPFDYERAVRPDKEPPPRTPGAILAVRVDREHWLGFGYDGAAHVLDSTREIYTPVKLDQGTNVAVYEDEDRLHVAGFLWPDKRAQLANKAWLVHQPRGRGHVVAFAEDPNVRAVVDGLNLMFLNAVLLTAGR